MKYQSLKNKISWTKSVVFILILLIFIVGYVYTHFRSISGSFPVNTVIPNQIQESIDSTVSRNSNIAGVQVVRVDLQKNIRFIMYSSLKDPEVKKIYNEFISDNITLEIPVFTKNQLQNSRMLSIINHEFVCYPFTETTSYELIPNLGKHIQTICTTTVPIERNKFSGFVAVFLKKEPTDTEKDIIGIESLRMAEEVYETMQ